ncbi:GntR family transcriptional regulator [Neorhizobium galegae]|uniref:Transcriptional regulator n=1 Tax=Neorhizobium galegae bv. officinalis TaxID=323656 RepID=A0A0T7H1I0_NEOGA|nr:GntR family transcriptional regulator [Neorhizobium galegae]MCQ1769611.1 GntR family transcriptional regulator [Neorhizobium galegae]MCQ1849639.1 GntR family transcriptional regulator [Neorhizobium galegae]CDZ41417.1 Transcriptional regulator [Neorhizobium galegae bv. officinalis]CDZ53414.1 Transcriptional regulator [Neorhizobium galegae bv. officinalis]
MSRAIARPLYEMVRDEIMQRVLTNQYEMGRRLPSAITLAGQLGVSVITIRRALQDLKTNGVLTAKPGLGTFVKESPKFFCNINFFSDTLVDQHDRPISPEAQLISITIEEIQALEFHAFKPPAGPMVCVRKVISFEGIPVMLDTAYAPPTTAEKFVDEYCRDLTSKKPADQGSLKGKVVLDAAPASEEARRAFGVPIGYPTLRRLYDLRRNNSSLSTFGIAVSPFDRLAMQTILHKL